MSERPSRAAVSAVWLRFKRGNFIFGPDLNLQRNWALVEKHDMAKIFLFCEIMRKDNVCLKMYLFTNREV